MYWMPLSDGATFTSIAPGNTSRLSIPSVREAEVGREYEGYTVTRLLLNVTMRSASALLVLGVGVILLQEDVLLSTVNPSNDPSSDWLWFEEFLIPDSGDDPLIIHRDIRSQRKARGGDSDMFIYATNRSGVSTAEIHRGGRALVKRA